MTDNAAEHEGKAAGGEPPLDRTISPISGRLAGGRAGKAMVMGALLAGCAAFAFAGWRVDRPVPDRTPQQPARQVVPFEPAAARPPTLAAPGADAPALTDGPGVVPPLEAGGVPPMAAAQETQVQAVRAAELHAVRGAPILAWSRTGAVAPVPDLLPAMAAKAQPVSTELDQLRRGSVIGQARAQRLADRSYLILAGTSIPCVLQTAMDSSTAGYATCLIPDDIWSDNGAVVLLEKGTRVLGEYRSGMRQGQRRLFVLWTRAVTPGGVAVALGSPAADVLGRSGFDGDIDTRFWDRFGGTVLLSVVDSGSYAIAGGGGPDGAARLPSDAAGLALQGSLDIPPTLRKPQGSEVSILAAQDLDFSGVYVLKARTP